MAVLIAAHAGAYVAQLLLESIGQERWLWDWLALSSQTVEAGRLWVFGSFPFLHDGPLHLLANVIVLYFAGRELEPIVGTRHFLGIYVAGAFAGGITQWLVIPGSPVVGATAGIVAVVLAFTTILPELELCAHLFFILPVRVRAKRLALLTFAASGILYSVPGVQTIAVGMLVGAVVGWFYVKQLGYGNPFLLQRYLFERRRRAVRLARMSAEQFIAEEIDPILDKIAREGVQSLSRAERRLLALGRAKVAAKSESR
ncbi:MAG: rhomboid family intramembrane serine protease [Verrucomicrobiota bacterium]|nr:rhomboid family intramembrane serine protease [Verrucomicrobiota bacterium]